MYQNLKKKSEGFTIIEVLIVLAIAGLIMLIVFLAVPALQRNSRNNGRNNDASRIAAAVNDCLSNHNNVKASCDEASEVNVGNMSQLTDALTFTLSGGSKTQANVLYTTKCNADRSGAEGGQPATSFSVLYKLESANAAGEAQSCISS